LSQTLADFHMKPQLISNIKLYIIYNRAYHKLGSGEFRAAWRWCWVCDTARWVLAAFLGEAARRSHECIRWLPTVTWFLRSVNASWQQQCLLLREELVSNLRTYSVMLFEGNIIIIILCIKCHDHNTLKIYNKDKISRCIIFVNVSYLWIK